MHVRLSVARGLFQLLHLLPPPHQLEKARTQPPFWCVRCQESGVRLEGLVDPEAVEGSKEEAAQTQAGV